jgi:choline dehydrogenase-like flavoprotein
MRGHTVVVGSGASAVHFAQSLLERGWRVTMVDVGRDAAPPVLPDVDLGGLKDRLPDPADYFLGERFDGVMLPDDEGEYYGIPPHKQYIFDAPETFAWRAHGFAPLFSFARGGLAEAWTAGCYPFNELELADFPFDYDDLGRHYGTVAARIGVTGAADDLAAFMPVHDHLLPPLRLDAHSALLLAAYERRRRRFQRRLGCFIGRTRVATLSQPHDGRPACTFLGRCLWGCPTTALYTPSVTLAWCQRHPNFTYRSGLKALFVRRDAEGRARAVVVRPVDSDERLEIAGDRIALGAGALSSTAIVLRSIHEATGERVALGGLMDNRQLLVPFLTLRMLGRRYDQASYQYHLLGLGIAADDPVEYVHGQITTLKTALLHPILQRLPLDVRTAALLTRSTRAALGVVNVNLHDRRRPGNTVALDPGGDGTLRLAIRYAPDAGEPARIARALRIVKRALWGLGAIVPPGMVHMRPMGASVHYAGTLPMARTAQAWTTTPECESREFRGLYLVDGATFPFLPAKNITFTLMANAVRVAEAAF